MPNWSASECLKEYAYWSKVSREHAENPNLGRGSECYRAAAQMAARWLGRYDILAILIAAA